MRYKTLIIILIPIIVYTLYFLRINSDENTKLPHRIVLEITPNEYKINNRTSTDVVSLLTEEFITYKYKKNQNFSLRVKKHIKHERFVKTMKVLKSNGYNSISFYNENK